MHFHGSYRCSIVLALLCWGFSVCSSGCSSGRSVESNASHEIELDADLSEPTILFLHLWVVKDSLSGTENVRLHDLIWTNGTLKKVGDEHGRHLNASHLIHSFLDHEEQPVQQVVTEHPLRQRYEHVGEDGQFRSTVVDLQEAQLALRIQWDKRIRYLRVESIHHSGKKAEIAMLSIEQTAQH